MHFQKSAKEHRRKCLPLLQLSLRHVADADAPGAGTAAGGGVGTKLSSCRDTDACTPRECGAGEDESWTAKQIQKGPGQGNTQELTSQAKPRTGSRGRVLDGPRSARRGDDTAHPSPSSQAASRHEAIDITSLGHLVPSIWMLGSAASNDCVHSCEQ